MSKRFKIVIAFVLLTFTSNAQSIMIGAGGAYGSVIEKVAPNFRIYYGLTEQICFGPEYAYFRVKHRNGKDIQLSEYGFVAHYIFELDEHVGFYPLLGFNYSVENETHNRRLMVHEAAGFTFGVGFHLNYKNFMPFAEYKYISGELSQSTVSAGLIYNLHLAKERATHGIEDY